MKSSGEKGPDEEVTLVGARVTAGVAVRLNLTARRSGLARRDWVPRDVADDEKRGGTGSGFAGDVVTGAKTEPRQRIARVL